MNPVTLFEHVIGYGCARGEIDLRCIVQLLPASGQPLSSSPLSSSPLSSSPLSSSPLAPPLLRLKALEWALEVWPPQVEAEQTLWLGASHPRELSEVASGQWARSASWSEISECALAAAVMMQAGQTLQARLSDEIFSPDDTAAIALRLAISPRRVAASLQ